jgi:ATP-dependent protease ClpP protease subunit
MRAPLRSPAWFPRARALWAEAKARPRASSSAESTRLDIGDFIGWDDWTQSGVTPADVIATLGAAKGALEVHVNSPGGFVFDGLAIYNAIRTYDRGPVTVYVDGLAASIASVIALAGQRVVTNQGAMWMVHDPTGGLMVWGTADEIEQAAATETKALRKVRENLLDIYVTATERPASELSALMTAETWMTADEALARGFTDEIGRDEPEESIPKAASAAGIEVRAQLARMMEATRPWRERSSVRAVQRRST